MLGPTYGAMNLHGQFVFFFICLARTPCWASNLVRKVTTGKLGTFAIVHTSAFPMHVKLDFSWGCVDSVLMESYLIVIRHDGEIW